MTQKSKRPCTGPRIPPCDECCSTATKRNLTALKCAAHGERHGSLPVAGPSGVPRGRLRLPFDMSPPSGISFAELLRCYPDRLGSYDAVLRAISILRDEDRSTILQRLRMA